MPSRPPRKLPVLVERSVRDIETLRTALASKFEMKVRTDVAEQNRAITCTPGCASCCYHPVMISVLEAIPMYRWLQTRGKWTDKLKAKLKDAADKQYGTAFEVWLFSLIPCPLLDEQNLCSAYEARPLICRAYYAVSDPDFCHPHRLGQGTEIVDRTSVTDPFHERQAEILKQHRVRFSAMPIGTALLYAERVCTGEMGLDSVDAELVKEYTEKG